VGFAVFEQSIGAVTRKLRLLLVDDDENDRLFFRSGVEEDGLNVDLFEATDGFAAINYLLGNEPYSDRAKFPLPDVMFLDLNMPAMDGLAVLKEIRASLGFQDLPIVVLSNSELQTDVSAAYALGASAFHKKPTRYKELVSLLRSVITLWHNGRSSPSLRRSKEI